MAQSTVEDRESSRVSEKAAEGKAATQKSSFVTGVCNRPAVVKLERASHTSSSQAKPLGTETGEGGPLFKQWQISGWFCAAPLLC